MRIPKFLWFLFILTAFTACQSCKTKSESGNAKVDSSLDTSKDDDVSLVNFSMSDLSGSTFTAKDEFLRHKITIIDFWASWCGPCRAEMPLLVETYNAYKDKGLGIIGVSLDDNKTQWESAVRFMNMTWPQVSDLQGWNNSVAKQFGIQAIPFTIIVDSRGKPLQVGLRGDALVSFVEAMLK